MIIEDIQDWSDQEIDETFDVLRKEQERRNILRTVVDRSEELSISFALASGMKSGDEWSAPTGGHNAYFKGAKVTHDGKLWESTTASNVWEPGVSGWRELVPGDHEVSIWQPPTGAHDSYVTGDRVLHSNIVWESLVNGNVWEPEINGTTIWKRISPPVDPTALYDWVQPTGSHNMYSYGSRVRHNGQVWVANKDNNVWEPGVYGWASAPEEDAEDPDVVPEDPEEVPPVVEEPPAEDPVPAEAPAWVQPTGGHDAYAVGSIVFHGGRTWKATLGNNVWEPGAAGWEIVS